MILEEDIGYVNEWDICDKKGIHPSHRIAVVEVDKLILAISHVRDEIVDFCEAKNKTRCTDCVFWYGDKSHRVCKLMSILDGVLR